jgi:hypothetical protein
MREENFMNELEQLNRLKAAVGRKPEETEQPQAVVSVREPIRWPEQTTDAQGSEWKVTRPKTNKWGRYLAGPGALPCPIVPHPGEERDFDSPESPAYDRAAMLRISANVAFERLLGNLYGKAICRAERYDPQVQGRDSMHSVGGESFYAVEVDKDLNQLRGIWQALGINGPSEEELLKMAGVNK